MEDKTAHYIGPYFIAKLDFSAAGGPRSQAEAGSLGEDTRPPLTDITLIQFVHYCKQSFHDKLRQAGEFMWQLWVQRLTPPYSASVDKELHQKTLRLFSAPKPSFN